MNNRTLLIVIGYYALFFGSTAAMLWWSRRGKKTRKPFGDDFKLLRSAGETQLNFVRKCDDNFPIQAVVAAGAPVVVLGILWWVACRLPPAMQIGGIVGAVAGFIATFIGVGRWLTRQTLEYSNRYLGYFGERVVGENLEPLKAAGWRIFHDLPGEANGAKFNLDHIAVGPGGVFAIETKTRRKGHARPGFEDHKVYFDGRDLVWPWGEDNHGLDQAERNALWLTNWIRTEIGERVHVSPVLVLPGWWVENKPARETRLCRVLNPKNLPAWLAHERPVLAAKQIDAIAARLEARCRDVEY